MSHPYTDIEQAFHNYLENVSQDNSNLLIQACQWLVFHYAKLYGGGYCFEDLCQSGYEGLWKAVQNFDSKFNTKFVTYASHAIIGEIRHFVRKESKYYYPEYLGTYREKMDSAVAASLAEKDEVLTVEEVAKHLNLKEESVMPAMAVGLVHLGHLELKNIRANEYESFALPVEDKLLISKLMYKLTGVQKDVIEMLFYKGLTQEEVAQELMLSQKQVSRIKIKGLEKMKHNKQNAGQI